MRGDRLAEQVAGLHIPQLEQRETARREAALPRGILQRATVDGLCSHRTDAPKQKLVERERARERQGCPLCQYL